MKRAASLCLVTAFGLGLVTALGLVAALGLSPLLESVAEAAPPPGMPDPSSMSGIPRPDPNLSPGTVTVRCLDGGFASPAIGIEVELEITTAAGSERRTTTSADQGRATFTGLDEFFGQSVVARATIAGQELRSQSFVLGPQAGVALLLVKAGGGASAGPPPGQPPGPHGAPSQAADPHGGQGAVPMPGKPFPLAGRPPGTLIVGTLDLGGAADGGIGPIPDVEVTLTATAEGLDAPIIETATTDAEGRAMFEGLDERLPEGAAIVVEAVLEDGQPARRSDSFSLGSTAYAIVLTRGESKAPAGDPHGGAQGAGGPPQQQRMPMPPPRVDRSLKPGQVRVVLVDARDQPVVGQQVVVHSSMATGAAANHSATTDDQGQAIVEGVPLAAEMLEQVQVVYAGAPYTSTLFEMPEDAGAIVMLRVYEPTGDRTRVRSALQIDVSPREKDFAAVSFNYAVFVDGDEAFWVPGGMTLFGPPGTRSLHVMDEAKNWLIHDGEAPWVELDRPLEPGVEIRLSFAVGLEHDGSLELQWTTPFPLVDDASLVTVPEELSVTHGVAGAPELNPHAGRDGGAIELYELGSQPFAIGVCDVLARVERPCPFDFWGGNDVEIVVEELPVRPRVWPVTAWILLGAAGLGLLGSVALRRRVRPREALLTRRDALIAELVALDESGVDTAEVRAARAKLLRTLDRIYRQLEALGPAASE